MPCNFLYRAPIENPIDMLNSVFSLPYLDSIAMCLNTAF